MPELPEVEAWRRGLTTWMVGRTLVGVRGLDPGLVRPRLSTRPSEAMLGGPAWLQNHVGQTFDSFERAGKRLGVAVGEHWWLVHLGMTGRFERSEEPPKAARAGLELDDGATVWFCDQRRFGCIAPLSSREALAEGLGPDALSGLSGSELSERFSGRRAIKVALLDQACLAGLGNIHAAEALWRARIHPDTSCVCVAPEDWARLAEAILSQLTAALEEIPDLHDFVYVSDGGANPFSVYDREDQPCSRCGDSVRRQVQSGRSTYWCPTCQPPC